MKNNKAPGISKINVDILNAGGEQCLMSLTDIMRVVWEEESIPEEWRKSLIVPIFKKRGDILECGNYRGIKLLGHGLKIWEKILDQRFRAMVEVDPKQFAFMPGKSTIDTIFIVRQIVEKRIEGNLSVFCGFVHLKKEYNRVPREVMYSCLRRRGIPEKLVRLVMETYKESKTAVRTAQRLLREFEIRVGLHQGSALSPLLFAIVTDDLSQHLREEDLWTLLFADDLAIMADSAAGQLQDRLVRWQEGLERYGLKVKMLKRLRC